LQTGKVVGALAVSGISVIRDCSYSDMHGLVAIAADRTVQTIDTREHPGRSSQSVRALSDSIGGAECAVAALECSQDGRYIACGRSDSTLGIMSLYFMGDGRNCYGHTASINSVHIQKDSNFIWTASSDKSARSFRVSSGGANKTLQSHSHGISCVRTSGDGSLVVTGGLDSAAVVTWTQQSANQAPLHIIAHDSALTCVAFTPDEDQVITCSDDGGVMLWCVDALTKLPRIKQFEMQNQMFEDEYHEYQSSLNDHKSTCRRCSAFVSSTSDLLQWENRHLKKCDKVPSFTVSASAHDSVSPAFAAAGSVQSKKRSCGIQRLQFFESKSDLACAIGRPGVGLFRIGEARADHQ
jgi:WD40 repeat protein